MPILRVFRHSHLRYDEVAQEVLDESIVTANDQSQFKVEAVKFFDNKFGSLVPLKALYFVL